MHLNLDKSNGLLEEGLASKNLSPMGRFQVYSERVSKLLEPEIGKEIDEPTYEALGKPYILFVGNPKLNRNAFTLRRRDYQSIGNLVIPGRSAFFDFLGTPIDKPIEDVYTNKKMLQIVKQLTVRSDLTRSDYLWVATLEDINNAGYAVYYAPVSTNSLHLRLIWKGHANLSYPYETEVPPVPDEVLDELIGSFRRIAKIQNEDDSIQDTNQQE